MRTDLVLKVRRGLLVLGALALAAVALSVFASVRSETAPPILRQIFAALQTSAAPRVGIVAGHSGYDSGAVCPDGLTEVEVNLLVANAVADLLRNRGINVDILAEYDERLRGYRADAFVSIHADSCEIDLSGFKVASLKGRSISEPLAYCLWTRYSQETGLAPHPNTITDDMRDYHAFRKISPFTPAAIIEIGFLSGDRQILTQEPALVAAGIVAGIECLLTPEPPQ